MKTILTQATIADLKPGPTAYDVSDAQQRGLVLRVWTSGRCSWLVRIGKRWLTLGQADVIPPVKARKLAQAALGDAASGADPIATKAKAKRDATSLDDFLTRQYEPWASAHLKTTGETAARVRAAFPDLLPKRLTEITAFAIERWRVARHQANITPSTTNRDLDCLRSVLSKAVEWRVLTAHPMTGVKRAKLDTTGRLRCLSPDEATRLRAALSARDAGLRAGRASFNAWRRARQYATVPDLPTPYADHLEPLVLTALGTGARRGELFSLTWGDVDLDAARVTFTGATTKTGKTRHVPLGVEPLAVLTAWRAQQPETRRAADALVFPSPQGGGRLDNITTSWGALVKAAKLDDFTFHDLRHTFASNLVERGVDLYRVQRLLGHASGRMTERYAHLSDAGLVAAVAKLG